MGMLAVNVNSNLYVLTAFGAGVISFLSPCVLPIVPGYLSLITGLSVGELRERPTGVLGRIAINTAIALARTNDGAGRDVGRELGALLNLPIEEVGVPKVIKL